MDGARVRIIFRKILGSRFIIIIIQKKKKKSSMLMFGYACIQSLSCLSSHQLFSFPLLVPNTIDSYNYECLCFQRNLWAWKHGENHKQLWTSKIKKEMLIYMLLRLKEKLWSGYVESHLIFPPFVWISHTFLIKNKSRVKLILKFLLPFQQCISVYLNYWQFGIIETPN